jgi:1-acyl-sn-glycerol-3-phosphate acyltransferase
MILFLFRILFRLYEFKIITPENLHLKKAVVVAAPHTSNWDGIIGFAYYDIVGIKIRFAIKDSYMSFPLGLIFKPMGGIAINRNSKEKGGDKKSMTQAMIDLFAENDELNLLVTPEGTRKKVTKWKTGFYYVALGAKVPIALGYMDFEKKEAGIGKVIYPSGDIDKDMREIMDFYRNINGRHPERFSLDLDYA